MRSLWRAPRNRLLVGRLTQVLLNLAGNAIKFTDSGEVAIKASASDGRYTVSVCDTGPGISEADQAKLFQEFQQADNSITRKKGGTGHHEAHRRDARRPNQIGISNRQGVHVFDHAASTR